MAPFNKAYKVNIRGPPLANNLLHLRQYNFCRQLLFVRESAVNRDV